MAAYNRPGVFANETLTPSNTAAATGGTVAAILGSHWRGPVTPTLISSWGEFQSWFGGFTSDPALFSYLPFGVFTFFNNGGRQCYVSRVVGSSGVSATRTLVDRSATPQNTLRVDANNQGAWGNSIYITVSDRDAAAGTFDVVVKYGGTGNDKIVERWLDVSVVDTAPRYIEAVVNDPDSGSRWVTITDLDSVTSGVGSRPAAVTDQVLASGANSAVPSAGDFNTSLGLLNSIETPLVLLIPGATDATTHGNLITYAAARGDCFALLDPVNGTPVSSVITAAQALTSDSHAAMYYPWIKANDPAGAASGAVRELPPSGFVAGTYARVDTQRGVHHAPAGYQVRLGGARGIVTTLTTGDLDNLNNANVNALKVVPTSGIAIMGARTLKLSGADRYVPVRRTLIALRAALIEATKFAVFEPNDEALWQRLSATCGDVCRGMWQAGAFKGSSSVQAYYVKCDSDINTPSVIAGGEVRIEVGVALQTPAEFIVINIGQWESGATVVEII